MQLAKIIDVLNQLAPPQMAEPWDNVGLLAGDPEQEISRAMLTIDYTRAVADEARAAGCDLIISYHPPIFEPLKRLSAGHLVFDAIRRGVAIYSPHTALDIADGGTNDMLADAIGLTEHQPLRVAQHQSLQYKLVAFVPAAHVEHVSRAIFDAGAGRIGRYSSCSFRSPGNATFFGEAGANPTIGQSGKVETTEEIRLETVVPIERIDQVIRALRASHPYEEPAFDLNQLAAPPSGRGQGRIGSLPATQRMEIFDRIKRELELSHLLIAGPLQGTITRAAVCAGSCGDHVDDAIAAKAALYLTGEMRHHDAIKAAEAGMTVICTLHSNSERAVLKRVRRRLDQMNVPIPILISAVDRDPFSLG